MGEQLVEKLVKKNIAIDLSHANEKTFYDIIAVCKDMKKQGYNPIIHASHSNVKAICDVPRNLTDKQIETIIQEFDGTVGIVEYKEFVGQHYLKHINHIKKLIGNSNNITLATDDMTLYNRKGNTSVYKHKKIAKEIRKLLHSNGYSETEIEGILHKNFEEKILERII